MQKYWTKFKQFIGIDDDTSQPWANKITEDEPSRRSRHNKNVLQIPVLLLCSFLTIVVGIIAYSIIVYQPAIPKPGDKDFIGPIQQETTKERKSTETSQGFIGPVKPDTYKEKTKDTTQSTQPTPSIVGETPDGAYIAILYRQTGNEDKSFDTLSNAESWCLSEINAGNATDYKITTK